MKIHIDFETRSVCDIKKVGSYRYSEDPTTDILCLGYAFDEELPHIWLPATRTPPQDLLRMISNPNNTVHAWNAEFEMHIWSNICVKRLGWPEIQLYQWRDTMAKAAAMSLPLAMDDTAEILGTARKHPEGYSLIQKLCKPYKGQFRSIIDFGDDFLKLYSYCKHDVAVERHLDNELKDLPARELQIWRHCLQMNLRGLPIDQTEVNAVIYQVDKAKDRLNATLPFLTKGEVTSATQVGRLLKWVRKECSGKIENLNAATIIKLLNSKRIPDHVKHVLRIRQHVSKSSTAKLKKAILQVCEDSTIKNNYIYYGANTGRYAGRGFQMQNLPARGLKVENPDEVIRDFVTMDFPVLNLTYHIMETASALIRPLLKAPPNKKFIVGDFKSIEAIVTPWIARESRVLQSIAKGLDLYIEIAAKMFNIPYEIVNDRQRQIGKVCVLACGFAGGVGALLRMAENYGLEMNESSARPYVDMFRAARPTLVQCWQNFERAAEDALNMKAPSVSVVEARSTAFSKEGPNLTMRLPSGRKIYYQNAFQHYADTPWGSKKLMVHYYTKNSTTQQWEARAMTGGNFFQNAVQGVARDLLTNAQLNLESAGYPICLSTHDECGGVYPDDAQYDLQQFLKTMTIPPAWATDLPLEADGWEGQRYRK
jgi:DNA polymerase